MGMASGKKGLLSRGAMHMKENTQMIRNKVRAFLNGRVEISILELLWMTRGRASVR